MLARRSPRLVVVGVAVLAALSNVAAGAAPPPCPPSPFRTAKPLVIAHASSTQMGPANTIEMMRAALRAGADVLDVDVRVSADGVTVASHDDNLVATTGTKVSLRSLTVAELQRLDAAALWPGPKGDHPLRGKGVRIPTVEAVLKAFPGHRISLELKAAGGERQLCALLTRTGRLGDVYVGSSGDAPVEAFKAVCPKVTTTMTDAMVSEMQRAGREQRPWCAPVLIGQPPFRIGTRRIVTANSVRWDHDHGFAVYTWTLDSEADLRAARQAGVDGVYTGRPDLARKVFDERSGT